MAREKIIKMAADNPWLIERKLLQFMRIITRHAPGGLLFYSDGIMLIVLNELRYLPSKYPGD